MRHFFWLPFFGFPGGHVHISSFCAKISLSCIRNKKKQLYCFTSLSPNVQLDSARSRAIARPKLQECYQFQLRGPCYEQVVCISAYHQIQQSTP